MIRPHHSQPRRLWLPTTLCLFLTTSIHAQTVPSTTQPYAPTATFDVASIRQNIPKDWIMVSGSFAPHGSTVTITNYTIWNLLSLAYGNDFYYRIKGIPDSLSRSLYNIQARSGSETDARIAKLNKRDTALEQRHMLQQLLADRFQLKVHWETEQGDIYNLAIKNSSKLQPTKGAPPSPEEVKRFGEHPIPPLYQRGDSRTGFDFVGNGASIQMLVSVLSGQFGRPVIDKTGLTGQYDFILRYWETTAEQRPENDTNPLPPLDQALQTQLGLKLQPAKGPIPILIIDHVEKPSDN